MSDFKRHTIQSGDTMWSIAQKFNMPLSDLINANHQIHDPEILNEGDFFVTHHYTVNPFRQLKIKKSHFECPPGPAPGPNIFPYCSHGCVTFWLA